MKETRCYWNRNGAGFNMFHTAGCNNKVLQKMPINKICPHCNNKITNSYIFYLISKLFGKKVYISIR